MKKLNEEVTEVEMKKVKTGFIALIVFAAIMIVVGTVTGIIVGIMQAEWKRLDEENKKLEDELDELNKLNLYTSTKSEQTLYKFKDPFNN